MKKCTHALLALAGAGLASASAAADLVVLRGDGQPATDVQATVNYDSITGTYEITLHALYAPGGATVYEIRGNGGEVIDNLSINVPCWTGPNGDCVPAGSPVFVRVLSDPPFGMTRVNNIVQTGEAETLLTHVQVNEDIGSVTAQAIGILEAGRDVNGPIVSITNNNFMRGIGEVHAGRDMRANLSAPQGRIGIVDAGRNVGAPGDPVIIECRHNTMSITAAEDVYATVRTNINNGNGHLYNLACKRFVGELHTPRLSWEYWGKIRGHIRITDAFEGLISIGESFSDPAHQMELPASALAGQVIVNAKNLPDGTWTEPMYVGVEGAPDTLMLPGPDYPYSSAELGGGAVGLVPFRLHMPSCQPVSGGTVTVQPGDDPVTIVLEHDGPVTLAGSQPVTVSRRAAGSVDAFGPVPPAQFLVQVDSANPRRVLMTAADGQSGFSPGYEYRIESTELIRSAVPGEPAVYWPLPYRVTIEMEEATCPGDVSGDGTVNAFDMLLMLAAWGPTGPFPAADLNGDGWVNVMDLLEVLANWGPCESGGNDDGSHPG